MGPHASWSRLWLVKLIPWWCFGTLRLVKTYLHSQIHIGKRINSSESVCYKIVGFYIGANKHIVIVSALVLLLPQTQVLDTNLKLTLIHLLQLEWWSIIWFSFISYVSQVLANITTESSQCFPEMQLKLRLQIFVYWFAQHCEWIIICTYYLYPLLRADEVSG